MSSHEPALEGLGYNGHRCVAPALITVGESDWLGAPGAQPRNPVGRVTRSPFIGEVVGSRRDRHSEQHTGADELKMESNDALLTPAQAAAESGFSIETIRVALRRSPAEGGLVGFQPFGRTGRIRIPRSELRRWLGRPVAGTDDAEMSVSA